ncbi:hypothetical protein C8R46DRAFT_113852 [Mycena filopes]|nr:hypothetical protein C8R46DRAFT_113852 [Mycena filopes]
MSSTVVRRRHRRSSTFRVREQDDTPSHTLLHSNDVPLEGEAAAIGAELATLDDRLHILDDESLRLREELGRLEEERVLVSKHRTQNGSILSAIRRMPPEILGQIFSWTLPGTAESLRTVVHLKESPWTLSHVSRYWRAVALSESSLWSTVALDYDRAPLYPLSMIETQVARATKLKVHFYGCEAFDTVLQIETFQFLAQYAPRWEELSLALAPHIAPLLSALRDRVPLLRIFFLQWEWQNALTIDRVDCFQNAPSLVRAWVSSHFQSIPVLFPAHHLTGYELYSSWDTHADILKHTQNLIVARISVEFGGEDNIYVGGIRVVRKSSI